VFISGSEWMVGESRDTSTGASGGWPVKALINTLDFTRPRWRKEKSL